MKTKHRICVGKCPSDPREHVFRGTIAGAETPFGKMTDEHAWECLECGNVVTDPVPKPRCRKRSWPYYNESTGVNFESESHEKAYVKENKLEAL